MHSRNRTILLVSSEEDYKKSHSITQTLIVLNKFVFYSNNCLVPLQIWSYRESTVAAPISSLARHI